MNPSFPLTQGQADVALEVMQKKPVKLRRPVVVLDGWRDPGLSSRYVASTLRDAIGDLRIIEVSFMFEGSYESCRKDVVEAVEKAYPNADPGWTSQVDVVAISMGGLIARYAALGPDGGGAKRLNVARMFTICTPHTGSDMVGRFVPDDLIGGMAKNSAFLARLNRELSRAGYEVIPYGRLDDVIVGVRNTAPPGEVSWWVPTPMFGEGHSAGYKDPRILADIAARLRGETPFTTTPRTPVPEGY